MAISLFSGAGGLDLGAEAAGFKVMAAVESNHDAAGHESKHLLELHDLGTYTQAELAELFGVGRSTIYRTLERMRPAPPESERPFARLANPQTMGRA